MMKKGRPAIRTFFQVWTWYPGYNQSLKAKQRHPGGQRYAGERIQQFLTGRDDSVLAFRGELRLQSALV